MAFILVREICADLTSDIKRELYKSVRLKLHLSMMLICFHLVAAVWDVHAKIISGEEHKD